jgi:trehalose/maltose hydrolase-like predicted phosphorylase
LGYSLPEDYAKRNFDFYIARTSHGSTLSRLVHARLAWETGMNDTGWELYMDSLRSDLVDIQGGTTGEGIHCGVMAGTVFDALASFAGMDLRGEIPEFEPRLPEHWEALEFQLTYRGMTFFVFVDDKQIKISRGNSGKDKIKFHICGTEIELAAGESASLALN